MSLRSALTIVMWLAVSLVPTLPLLEVGVEGGDLLKLLIELPLAFVVCYAIREFKPVLREHLRQQRTIVQRLTVAVESMSRRLDRIEDKLGIAPELEEAIDAA